LASDVGKSTRQKTMANKTDYRKVTVCRNDLAYTVQYTVHLLTVL